MEEFRSCKVPKEYIFDVFPHLRPREFSIASSVLVSDVDPFRFLTSELKQKPAAPTTSRALHSYRPIPNKAQNPKERRCYDIPSISTTG